jgi:hypothetical protein
MRNKGGRKDGKWSEYTKRKREFLQDGDKFQKGKKIDHQGLRVRTIPNICQLPDPRTFSLVPTFNFNFSRKYAKLDFYQIFFSFVNFQSQCMVIQPNAV